MERCASTILDRLELQIPSYLRGIEAIASSHFTNAQKALVIKPVDALLEQLGLHVAEADVKVTAADCGAVGLVH